MAVSSGRVESLPCMGARFIGMDREQTFLMPPSVRDWVPEGHLVWTVLESVGELDLSAFYAEYRADGHGRPAYEPSMMVALLLYAYARGNRSARGVERACVEDVAFRVAAGNLVPDHSTIAEFRRRHERALAEVFSGVLGLCSRAGLASVGVVAIDGTKMSANAAINSNRDFGQIAREILREADEIDRREDELYGTERGDELPEHLRTREGRRKAFREAKERLQREREAAEPVDDEDAAEVSVELDPDHFVTRPQGRRAWLREGRRGLDAKRERQARPIAQERADRLFEACRRLEEELDVEQASNAAYEAWRARGIAADRADQHDRPRLAGRSHARAAAAAGLQRASCGQRAPDRRRRRDHRRFTRLRPPRADGERDPSRTAPARPRRPAGRARRRRLLAPTADRARRLRRNPSAGSARRRTAQRRPARLERRLLRLHAPRPRHTRRPHALPPTTDHRRARLRPDQVQPGDQTLPTARQSRMPKRMETDRGHAQPAEAPQPPDRRNNLNGDPAGPAGRPRRPRDPLDADRFPGPNGIYPTASRRRSSGGPVAPRAASG